jgi:hypothetical protein
MPQRQFTPRQYLDAVIRNDGSRTKAAEELGVGIRALLKNLKTCKEHGLDVPESDYHKDRATYLIKQQEAAHLAAPNNFHVKGVSTLIDADGEVRAQWIKTNRDQEEQTQKLTEAIKAVFKDEPRVRPISSPRISNEDLMTFYPIGDAHCGMHSWREETGEDFDLKIFEEDLVNAVRRLVKSAPRSKYAAIVDVGDYFHVNDKTNRTPASGHNLDVDSRYSKMIRVGVKVLRACIELAARRHEIVYVFIRPGNHNPDAYIALQVALGMYYEDNPRVIIDQSPAPFVYHEFGKNLIGITHGDKTKLEDLGEIMAADKREAWGRTEFHYWYTGHIHQRRVVEGRDWTAESFRTLAAKDNYATGAGYRSGRDMYAIALHREWGEQERHRIDISQLRPMRSAA